MSTTLRALIFDVDGTLADTEECHRLAFNASFAAARLDWYWDRERYRELLRVAGGRQRIRAHAAEVDPAIARAADFDARVAALHADKTRRYDELLRDQALALRPGIARIFAEAEAAGVPLALATTTTAANLDALLAPHFGANWRERFAAIVCAEDVTALKPAPDAYLEALRRMQLDASDCLAFEDSSNGIRSAEAAGLAVIVSPTWYSHDPAMPPGLVSLPHLGDPNEPLPAAAPGAPWVDLRRLCEWHAGAYAASSASRIRACS